MVFALKSTYSTPFRSPAFVHICIQDAPSKPLPSSTFPPTSTPRSHIDTPPTPSSSIVYQHHDQAKSSVLWAPTVLARVQPSKSSQESSSPTSAVTMFVHPHLPAHPAEFSLPCRIHQIGKKSSSTSVVPSSKTTLRRSLKITSRPSSSHNTSTTSLARSRAP